MTTSRHPNSYPRTELSTFSDTAIPQFDMVKWQKNGNISFFSCSTKCTSTPPPPPSNWNRFFCSCFPHVTLRFEVIHFSSETLVFTVARWNIKKNSSLWLLLGHHLLTKKSSRNFDDCTFLIDKPTGFPSFTLNRPMESPITPMKISIPLQLVPLDRQQVRDNQLHNVFQFILKVSA